MSGGHQIVNYNIPVDLIILHASTVVSIVPVVGLCNYSIEHLNVALFGFQGLATENQHLIQQISFDVAWSN